jgi:hypothetical protein
MDLLLKKHVCFVDEPDHEPSRPVVGTDGKIPVYKFLATDKDLLIEGGYETFLLRRILYPSDWSFCKTEHRPYDALVVAALITLENICKDDPVGFSWSSDGDERDHQQGRELAGSI